VSTQDFRKYESAGALDDTHRRNLTYVTADQYLFSLSPDLEVKYKLTDGSVPLWWLRRYVFSRVWRERFDKWGYRHWPNLCCGQVFISVFK
jgi:hypothetical protein